MIALVLLITGSAGCLGGQQQTQKEASKIILTASDIPGTWTEGAVLYFTSSNYSSNYAIKDFRTGNDSVVIEIIVVVYNTTDMAHKMYQYQMNNVSFHGISHPNIGDEAFMQTASLGLFSEGRYVVFRVGQVLVAGIAAYYTTFTVDEQWFIDLMKTQASKI